MIRFKLSNIMPYIMLFLEIILGEKNFAQSFRKLGELNLKQKNKLWHYS